MTDYKVLHRSSVRSESARQLQAATNRRLDARGLDDFMVKEDGILGPSTLVAVRKAAWALGALPTTYENVTKDQQVSVGVQRMIRNPGLRTPEQQNRGRARIGQMQAARKAHAREVALVHGKRDRVRDGAELAAAHYRANPAAYHYFAGGIANLIYLTPSPWNYRSDCSQFGAAVYKGAGLPSPGGTTPHAFTSTYSMATAGVLTRNPKMGDLGMYGSRWAPHHVEIFLVTHFIGHGTRPIDSMTPGYPDFFLTYEFLN